MKKTILLYLILPVTSYASNLEVTQAILYIEDDQAYCTFNLKWDNAWNNDKNSDGAWLFFKVLLNEGGYRHVNVLQEGHEVVSTFSGSELSFEIPEDGVGLFVFPSATYRGKIEVTLKISLDPESFEEINTRSSLLNAYGIEMVKIPEGGFEVGDPGETALDYGSFYQPDRQGDPSGPVSITSESQELEVSPNGDIYYQVNEGYEGDQKGTLPASFPKGFSSFYTMKYELTEGQYADFLNSLDSNQITDRLILSIDNYASQGGTIVEGDSRYFSLHPDKPCRFTSWDDAMAYADWAGLRPMTEFEFTKASRGTGEQQKGDFPWGSNDKLVIQRLPNPDGRLVMVNDWDESKLDDDSKAYFGASYYWVMDLAGSLWERLISIGHPTGRSFIGSHGDGIISSSSKATNDDWPTGNEESGGVGFRGGGFYGYSREYHEFNPFSPIAYRPYGGWHGTMRSISYGTRFVRGNQ